MVVAENELFGQVSLLLEDQDVQQEQAANYTLCYANDTSNPPTVIVLDYDLLEQSPAGLCRRLKADYRTSNIPIIIIANSSDPDDKLNAYKVGADEYVDKAFLERELGSRIQGILNRRLIHDGVLIRQHQDQITELPNRDAFLHSLEQYVTYRESNPGYSFAVFFLDLDRFKVVNDSLGNSVGDELLMIVARRLREAMKSISRDQSSMQDVISRIGSDEFVLPMDHIGTHDEAMHIARIINDHLAQPMRLQGHDVQTSASIGIRICADEEKDPVAIIRSADTAMTKAKGLGHGRAVVYEEDMSSYEVAKLDMENQLRAAIAENQLTLYYQPIVSLETGELEGFETLVRWMHPERGFTMPGEFVPLAEESGLIVELGYWVLAEACATMAGWLKHHDIGHLNVNVSRYQLVQEDFADRVLQALEITGLPAEVLQLEITESTIIRHYTLATKNLDKLRNAGIRIALDDFGLGYSALSSLHRLPLDTLKIDRAFVEQANENQSIAVILQTIISLAKSLNLQAVAEGVEDPAHLALLQTLDCNLAQGYYLCRPVPEETIPRLIATWDPRFIMDPNRRCAD